MLVYHVSNNELVNKTAMSEECGLSAMRVGLLHSEMVADVVAQLMRIEASVRGKAELLAQSLYQHCLQHNVTYYYHPSASREYPGHTPLAITVARQTRRSVEFHFHYWDGVDACYCGVGLLFDTEKQRADLQRLADTAFGMPVKFSRDFSTIEVPEPVITR